MPRTGTGGHGQEGGGARGKGTGWRIKEAIAWEKSEQKSVTPFRCPLFGAQRRRRVGLGLGVVRGLRWVGAVRGG